MSYYLNISVRDLHNNMIKLSNNVGLDRVVDSVTQKVLISDKTLRPFIPPQVRKMTPKLCQICGCEICITPKDTRIYLNISRTRLVTDLKQKYLRINTHNSLFSTTSAAHYKDKLFPGGEFLYATVKYATQCTACLPIKPENIINIKCAFYLFRNFLSKVFLMENYTMDQMIN